ncbi:MAG: hypothetical protein IAG13_16395, partial [Deltaproteobacteria bacterium]|nr:hypothetical protein [Nannocystaceae bacterium]
MTIWSLQWDAGQLSRATARLPGGATIGLHPRTAEHALLGVCDVITDADDRVLARLAAVDWACPRSIPA